ncbi:MAG: roadblock/LC7 domain-containing protein [Candidatus Aminicenantes bacterium]|nr:roadblock/LC7 domain-containing protein [Candidatus Aminicenantes bacterium]
MSQETDAILNSLLSVAGSEGAVILSGKGDVIDSKFNNSEMKSQFDDEIKELVAFVNSLSDRENFGDPLQIFVQGSENQILIYRIDSGPYYVLVLGTSSMKTGFIGIAIEKTIPLFKNLRI